MTALAGREHDSELLIPDDDVADPELSIVIPALNEELTITDFVAWCHEGLAAAGVRGEILIVDSSTDETPRARARRGRARAARAQAGARPRLHGRDPATSAASGSSWATPTAPTTSVR